MTRRTLAARCGAALTGSLVALATAQTVGSAAAPPALTVKPPAAGAFSTRGALSSATPLLAVGDPLAMGWTLRAASAHAAATYSLTHLRAAVAVRCLDGEATTFTLALPDATATVPANSTAWVPTHDTAAASGYQVGSSIPATVCPSGELRGVIGAANVLYGGTMTSSDTSDAVLVAFHAVDPGATGRHDAHGAVGTRDRDHTDRDGEPSAPSLNCSRPAQNAAVAACRAPWTTPVSVHPAAARPATGGGSNPGTRNGGGQGGLLVPTGGSAGGGTPLPVGPGTTVGGGTTVSGAIGVTVHVAVPGPAGVSLNLPTHLRVAAPSVVLARPPTAHAHPLLAPVAPSSSAPAAPSLAVPIGAAGTSTVLGPVPVLVPSIADTLSRTGAALPWNWFLALAIVDGLLGVAILRRRRRPSASVD